MSFSKAHPWQTIFEVPSTVVMLLQTAAGPYSKQSLDEEHDFQQMSAPAEFSAHHMSGEFGQAELAVHAAEHHP
jgi:hypothetical protein